MAAPPVPGRRLDALQGLRAIAAGLVVYAHALDNFGDRVDSPPATYAVAINGFGVPLFFVISGFIITTTGSALPRTLRSSGYFARRRLIRLVPIYWILTTVLALKHAAEGASPTLAEYLRSLAFIPYGNELGEMRPVIEQGWTLNYEMFFYLTFAMLLAAPRLIAYATMTAGFTTLVALRSAGVLSSDFYELWALAEPLLFYFLAGVLLAVVGQRVSALAAVKLWVPLVAVSALLALTQVAASTGAFGAEVGTLEKLPICVLAVAICALVNTRDAGPVGVAVVAAGDGSYSTYLTHTFVMGPAASAVAALGLASIGPHVFAVGMTLVCPVAGYLVFRWVEDPLRVRMNRHWGGRHPLVVTPEQVAARS